MSIEKSERLPLTYRELPDVQLAELVEHVLELIGEDPQREGLLRTPGRVAKALKDLTKGYHDELEVVVNDAIFSAESSELIIVRNVEFYSLCEHHMLPFYGQVHMAYLPDAHILGLSKFARVVEMFARRLQVQERFSAQVADALMQVLQPRGVMVVVDAAHLCMMMRGIEKQGSSTRTFATRGAFEHDFHLRQEVLAALG